MNAAHVSIHFTIHSLIIGNY